MFSLWFCWLTVLVRFFPPLLSFSASGFWVTGIPPASRPLKSYIYIFYCWTVPFSDSCLDQISGFPFSQFINLSVKLPEKNYIDHEVVWYLDDWKYLLSPSRWWFRWLSNVGSTQLFSSRRQAVGVQCQASEPTCPTLYGLGAFLSAYASAWPHWPSSSNAVFLKHVAQRLHCTFFISHCKFFNFVDNYINFNFKPFKLSIINILLAFLFVKEPQHGNS